MASAQAARIGVVEPGVDAEDPGLEVPPGPGEPSGRSSAPTSPTTRKVAVGDAPSMLAEWGLLGGPGWWLAGPACSGVKAGAGIHEQQGVKGCSDLDLELVGGAGYAARVGQRARDVDQVAGA